MIDKLKPIKIITLTWAALKASDSGPTLVDLDHQLPLRVEACTLIVFIGTLPALTIVRSSYMACMGMEISVFKFGVSLAFSGSLSVILSRSVSHLSQTLLSVDLTTSVSNRWKTQLQRLIISCWESLSADIPCDHRSLRSYGKIIPCLLGFLISR